MQIPGAALTWWALGGTGQLGSLLGSGTTLVRTQQLGKSLGRAMSRLGHQGSLKGRVIMRTGWQALSRATQPGSLSGMGIIHIPHHPLARTGVAKASAGMRSSL